MYLPGAVHNASSLLTYDSWFLVHNFLYQPKHDPTFEPLFAGETTLNLSQAQEAAKLCGDDHFCNFDVAATGSLSTGNATRVAHQLHQRRMRSLQPGEGGQGRWAPCPGAGPPGAARCVDAWQLRPVVCTLPPSQLCPVAGWPHLPTDKRRATGTW